VKIGLTAYDIHAKEFLDLAAAADEAGFCSLWLGEHVVLPIGYSSEHPTTAQPGIQHHTGPIVSPDTELVDPLVQLAAAAAVTSSIELATGIFILPLRHPLAVARSVCTVQEIAGGRFMLGLGFGWLEEEFTVLDVPFAERVSRFEEGIEVLRAALQGGEVKHEGRHFSISGVQVTKRDTEIPLMLGGNTDRALRRATQLGDGWFSSGTPPLEEAVRLRDELRRRRAESEQAEEPFRLVFRVAGADPATVQRYADEGFEEVLIWADQVWPQAVSVPDKRAALRATAEALGLAHRAVQPPATAISSPAIGR
jgi:probable F420-dependent oxidoreductase